MKKITLTFLFTFFIFVITAKASCSYDNASCKNYYFKKYEGSNLTLEIGKINNKELYAIVKLGNKSENMNLTGNNKYMVSWNGQNNIASFSIDASTIEEMPEYISYTKVVPETDALITFISGKSGLDSTMGVASNSTGGGAGDDSNFGTKCYYDDSTACKRYLGLVDAQNNPLSIELGTSGSLGNYVIVSYDEFNSVYGSVGTKDNNYTVQSTKVTEGSTFRLESTQVFDNYPSQLLLSYQNIGDGGSNYYFYTIYVDSNSQTGGGEIDGGYKFDDDYTYTGMDCYGLLGDPNNANFPAYWLQLALEVMRYAAIIALVALSTVDFVKAIVSQNQDALKKAMATAGKRFIFAILIFFVPIVIELIMNLFGVYGTCAL